MGCTTDLLDQFLSDYKLQSVHKKAVRFCSNMAAAPFHLCCHVTGTKERNLSVYQEHVAVSRLFLPLVSRMDP